MKKLLVLVGLMLSFAGTAGATTYSYSFSGTSGTPVAGLGSAQMDISVVGSLLTMYLYNTSPYPLISAGYNAPAITGFGLNLAGAEHLTSYTLTAYEDRYNTVPVDLKTHGWTLGTTLAGVDMEYLPELSGKGIKDALYNPAAFTGLAAAPDYFTKATFTMKFDQDISSLALTEEFVRFQNVGTNGSLKLFGEQNNPVPEPGTMMLLGVGMLGLAVFGKRRMNKSA